MNGSKLITACGLELSVERLSRSERKRGREFGKAKGEKVRGKKSWPVDRALGLARLRRRARGQRAGLVVESLTDPLCEPLSKASPETESGGGERRKGRFAPSPTGPMHEGNARTALLAWLQARLSGGAFVLRIEDLDQPRVKPGSAEELVADLRWMGLDWEEGPDVGGASGPYVQSARKEFYAESLERLWKAGLLFPCFCSRKDLASAPSAPHGASGPIYPGTCRELGRKDAAPREGRMPALRFRVPRAGDPEARISFVDEVMGACEQDLATEVGDFVVMRADGLFAYQLAVVVDDALMGIGEVVRGEDLLDSSARQIALFRALGWSPPRFWHVPLVRDGDGLRMAKRDGSLSIKAQRESGTSAEAFVGQLASGLGLVPAGTVLSARELLAGLTLEGLTEALRKARSSDAFERKKAGGLGD